MNLKKATLGQLLYLSRQHQNMDAKLELDNRIMRGDQSNGNQ